MSLPFLQSPKVPLARRCRFGSQSSEALCERPLESDFLSNLLKLDLHFSVRDARSVAWPLLSIVEPINETRCKREKCGGTGYGGWRIA